MSFPEAGESAPDFEAVSETGEPIKLSDFRGQKVVLYFYPKADTPGCTTQSCTFRDNYDKFQERGVVVLGASPDTSEDQAAFKAKYNLPFTLIADADHAVSELYGLWTTREIERDGEKFQVTGTRRSTFIIDENGMVTWSKFGVDPTANTQEVLDLL